MSYATIIVGVIILIFAFGIDLVHSKFRTNTVASITESIGKLLLGTALSLIASDLFSGSTDPSEAWTLVMGSLFVVVILLYQAHTYSRQRDQTRDYLRKLVNEKRIQTRNQLAAREGPTEVDGHPVLGDEFNLLGDIVAEIVDADYIPDSIGNKWSSFERRRVRSQVAEWLTRVLGQPFTETELIVPEKDRRGLFVTKFLSIMLIILPLAIFAGLFIHGWLKDGIHVGQSALTHSSLNKTTPDTSKNSR